MNTKTVKCNLCSADNYKVIYRSNIAGIEPTVKDYVSTVNKYGFFNRLVSCKHCGLVYMNPRDVGVKDFYKKVVDNAYIESWEERAATFRNHLKILKKYKKENAKLLDIGCYAGIFPSIAQKEGYGVTGIEPSEWAAEFAKEKRDIEILKGCWDEVDLPQDNFDIVTMWDIVEHLENPSTCFNQVHKWLKKGGILAVSTHNIKGVFARLAGKKYPWLMRFHLYHFEPKTLRALLTKNDLTPILTKYYTKTISLKYVLGRLGIKTHGKFFEKAHFSLNTGDLFMIIARKT